MDEQAAVAVAEALGGETWNSGGGMWLVLFRRADGKIVALTDESLCVYGDEEVLQGVGDPETSVALR